MSDWSLSKSDATLGFLMRNLAHVLTSVGESAVAQRLPWRSLWAASDEAPEFEDGFPEELAERCMQAYSIALQLLDQAEENAVAQYRRQLESEDNLGIQPGWDQSFAQLKAAGFGEAEIADALSALRIEPVLTAHPTEAKRETILEHNRALYRLIVQLENSMWTSAERSGLEAKVTASLERLWRTGEIYLEKPALSDERRMVLHYLREVFPIVLPWFERRLRAAWRRAGFSAEYIANPERLPRLRFGDWVGGDRDGHPLVSDTVTAETLKLFRREALSLVDTYLERLAVQLSLSTHRQSVPATVSERMAELFIAL